MMKKLSFAALTLAAALCASAQDYYNVEVKTYVGTKLEDTFSFVMPAGKSERKGFEGKMLAKIYKAPGFPHAIVAELEREKKAAEEAEALASKTSDTSNYAQIAEEIYMQARKAADDLEKRAETATFRAEVAREKLNDAERMLENGKKNPAQFKTLVEAYKARHEAKEDVAPVSVGRKNDYEEYDMGSYCDFTLTAADKLGVTFNFTYAFSRFLTWSDSGGNNNGNEMTRFPIFETYFKMIQEDVTVRFGKAYCIQFGRQNPQEARSLREALQNSVLFGNQDPSAPKKLKLEDLAKLYNYGKTDLNVNGDFDDIRLRYSADAPYVVRAVIRVTPIKL